MAYVPYSQIALIDLLTSVGLKPDGIIGHSLGEVACGYADGCLSQREAVLAAYWRGQCIKEAKLPPGSMAAVGRYPLEAPNLLVRQPDLLGRCFCPGSSRRTSCFGVRRVVAKGEVTLSNLCL